MHEHFHGRRTTCTPAFGLYGQGGVGKTQIALKYAHMYSSEFDTILWMWSDTEERIQNECNTAVMQLGFPEAAKTSGGSRTKLQEFFQTHPRWLLILDNADDLSVVMGYWPVCTGGGGCIILTSRNPGVSHRTSPLTQTAKVECLEPDLAVELLMRLSPAKAYESERDYKESAREVAERSGGLPLALCHAASFVNESSISFTDVLKIWDDTDGREEYTEYDHYLDNGETFGYQKTLKSAWALSMARLDAASLVGSEGSLHDASKLLDILALLDPNGISDSVVTHFEKPNAIYQGACVSNRRQHFLARGKLLKLGLIEINHSQNAGKQTITIHRLVQEAAQRRWKPVHAPGDAKHRARKQIAFTSACYCVSEVFPRKGKGPSMISEYSVCAEHSSHVLSLARFYQNNKGSVEPDLLFAETLAHCGWYFYERQQITSAKLVLDLAEEVCLKITSGEWNLISGLIYNNLGAVWVILMDRSLGAQYTYKAIQHRENCLSMEDERIQELATSYGNYANHLRRLDPKENAVKYFLKGLNIRENCKGCTPDLLELTLHNIGNFFGELEEYDTAMKYIDRALSLHPQCQGPNSFIATTEYAHGKIQCALGNFESAYEIHKTCLKHREQVKGSDHPYTAASHHRVGCLAYQLGKDTEGIEHIRTAERIFRTSVDAHEGMLARTLMVLGKVCREIGYRTNDAEMIAEGDGFTGEGLQLVKKIKPDYSYNPVDTFEWLVRASFQ